MKVKLLRFLLGIIPLFSCFSSGAQVNIKILTPSKNVVAYTLTIGSAKFKCDKKGCIPLTAKQYEKLQDSKISFNITDKVNRDFYDEFSLCKTIDCCYATGSKDAVLMFNITLKKFLENKVETFYFLLNRFGEMEMIKPTKTG